MTKRYLTREELYELVDKLEINAETGEIVRNFLRNASDSEVLHLARMVQDAIDIVNDLRAMGHNISPSSVTYVLKHVVIKSVNQLVDQTEKTHANS